MTKPILHHYPLSPFAEKIRRMLAYCECPYDAVETSPMLPRKDLDLLTGGYRRIPVAQWGSDIYCDSRAIAERIAADCARPELAPSRKSPEQDEFIRHVDGALFFAVVGVGVCWFVKAKNAQTIRDSGATPFCMGSDEVNARCQTDTSRTASESTCDGTFNRYGISS